jgi:hypothetical protein
VIVGSSKQWKEICELELTRQQTMEELQTKAGELLIQDEADDD